MMKRRGMNMGGGPMLASMGRPGRAQPPMNLGGPDETPAGGPSPWGGTPDQMGISPVSRGMGVGWSSPDPGSPGRDPWNGDNPNPGGGDTHAPGPFDPGGGPGDDSKNFNPHNQTPWQRRNSGHGDTSTALDPPTWNDQHPSRAHALQLVQRHITDVAGQRRDQTDPGWRGRPYDPNDPGNAPMPGQNFGMQPGDARLVGRYIKRLPTPVDGSAGSPMLASMGGRGGGY